MNKSETVYGYPFSNKHWAELNHLFIVVKKDLPDRYSQK